MPSLADLVVAMAMAAAAGLVGSVAVMRRMALASDALSHVALPGIAVALLLHVDPFIGGLVALIAGTGLVWVLENRTRMPTESLIGILFSTALAIGTMLASGEDLLDALVGGAAVSKPANAIIATLAAATVVTFMLRARSRLVIGLVSRDLASTLGIRVARLDLLFLVAFALTVALGLRYLGVLLMGSLIIIPGGTARFLARDLRSMQIIAVTLAVGSTVAGSLLGPWSGLPSGPLTIVIAAAAFAASLLWRRAPQS